MDLDRLRPVARLFPDRSKRWVADTCRAGRIPGAVKIGREWLIRESAVAALTGTKREPSPPFDVVAMLRSKGLDL